MATGAPQKALKELSESKGRYMDSPESVADIPGFLNSFAVESLMPALYHLASECSRHMPMSIFTPPPMPGQLSIIQQFVERLYPLLLRACEQSLPQRTPVPDRRVMTSV